MTALALIQGTKHTLQKARFQIGRADVEVSWSATSTLQLIVRALQDPWIIVEGFKVTIGG